MALCSGLVEEDRYAKRGNDSFHKVIADKNNVILVAEDGARLAGFITASIRLVVRYPYPILQVDELYVDPDFREHGFGRQLLQAIEAAARENGCRKIYIESAYKHKLGHKFYEKNGYQNSGYYFLKML